MNPVFMALDTPHLEGALALTRAVRKHVGGVKLGLEFFAANGPSGVAEIASLGLPVFLDLKLHDIPNTVAKAVAALAPLEPALLTVHSAGGQAMLESAKQAAPAATRVIGVTVLTSLDHSDLSATGVVGSESDQVTRLAALARRSGLDGIVCSGSEVADVRAEWADGVLVVPGLRQAGADTGDQKRVVTPRSALADGASVLVVGRPITAAPDPAEAAAAIVETLA